MVLEVGSTVGGRAMLKRATRNLWVAPKCGSLPHARVEYIRTLSRAQRLDTEFHRSQCGEWLLPQEWLKPSKQATGTVRWASDDGYQWV
jgi:hypothetical protein